MNSFNHSIPEIIRKSILAILIAGYSLLSYAQPKDMTGTYTINGVSNFGGKTFATFAEAIDSLENRGVSGPVIVQADNGTYDIHVTIHPIPGSSAINSVTFKSESGDSTDVVLTYSGYSTVDNNYIIRLLGCSFITIQEITFDATPNPTSGFGNAIIFRDDVDSITIKNCKFQGKDGGGSYEYKALIHSQYSSYANKTLLNDYNTIENNLFKKGEIAVVFYSYGSSYRHTGNVIRNNICENQGETAAIASNYGSAITIEGNYITNNQYNTPGIDLNDVDGANRITDNRLVLLNPTRGIYLYNCEASGVTENTKGLLANNFVSLNSGGNSNYGIQLNNVDYYRVYHNSVNISSGNNTGSCAFRLEGSSSEGMDIRNNIFANFAGGYAYYVRYNASVTTSDYNNYFTTGNYLALWDDQITPSLEDLYTYNTKDYNSLTVNPIYFSDDDLHTTIFHLESKGVDDANIKTAVPNDIDGKAWDGTPDIGADEFDEAGEAMVDIYTIGGTNPDFATIKEAVDSLNEVGVSDNVYFHIRDKGTPYSEQFEILPVSGAGPDKRVCFMPENGDNVVITYAATSDNNYTIKMVRASYVDFKDLTINATNTSNSTVFNLTGMSSNDSIVGCTINSTGGALGTAAIYSTNSVIDGFHIHNSTISDGLYGIWVDGPATDEYNPENITIVNNDIGGHYYTGVYLKECDAPLVAMNEITNGVSNTDYWGIYLDNCINDFQVLSNIIHLNVDDGGIYTYRSDGTASFRGKIINNCVIANESGGNTIYGIETNTSDYIDIYYNTVHISKDNTSTSSRAYYNNGGSDLKVKNNNFVNFGPGMAYYSNSTTAIEESDYNNLFSAGLYLAYWGNKNMARMSDLLANNDGKDTHSYNMITNFLTTIGPQINSPFLDTAGVDISTDPDSPVSDDIYGVSRGSSPSIGAYQYSASVTPIAGGTYSIGAGVPAPGYTSILEAFTDLQDRGITGPVILEVNSGDYNEYIGKVFKIPGASQINTITFTSASGDPEDVSIFYSTDNTDYNIIFDFICVDHLTLKNMTITSTGVSYGRLIHFSGTFENNTIENNNLVSGNSAHEVIWIEGTNNDVTIKDNTITKGSIGISFYGNSSSADFYASNSLIIGNDISECDDYGIRMRYQFEPRVIANTVTNELSTYYDAISIEDCREEMLITGNRIFNNNHDKGIYLYNCDATTPTFHGLVSNNVVHVGGTYMAYGIELNNCTGTRLYNNSIYLTSTYSSTSSTRGIYVQSNNNDIEIINNTVHNAGVGYAYYVVDDQDMLQSDYNNFYSASSETFAYWEGSNYLTLAELKAASGMDANSSELDPLYVSRFDLRSGQPGLHKKATHRDDVTVDIDSVPRDPATPDIGAVEFSCVKPVFDMIVAASCLGDSTIIIDNSDSIAPGSTVGYNFSGGVSPEVWASRAGDTISWFFTTAADHPVKYFVYQIAGCSDEYSFNVKVLAPPELEITTQGAYCDTDDGWASVRVTKGEGPYSYFWSNGSTDTIAKDLALGTITVAVSDANGCSSTKDTVILEAIQVTVTQLKPSTCGIADGAAMVSATGGDPPYSYVWSNGETTDTNKVMTAGLHYVNVIDANGCYAQGSINLANDGSGPQITLNSLTSNDCYGDRDGAIDISVSGGTGTYSIEWSNGAATQDIDSLAAGIYNVIAEDTDGCLGAASFQITQPTAITISSVVENATCAGSDGSAVAVVSGGNKPYIYKWSTGGIYQIEEGLAAGVYSVTVTDAKGCKMVQPILVNNVGGPVVTITDVQGTGCTITTNGSISTSVSGGVPSYNYLWSPGGQTTPSITGLSPGSYQVRVTDFNNCVGVNSTVIRQEPPDVNPICLVTVDTATDVNMVVWEKLNTTDVSHYNIYRESSVKGEYQLIGSRNVDSLSVFVDPVADPTVRSWRYCLSVVDECGNESKLSDPHKTMHLTMNLGLNDAVNLIWDHYEGFDVPTYDIYKYLPATGWANLTSLAANLTSYTDANVTDEGVYYFIEIMAPEPGCTATDFKAATLNSSRSNRKGKLKISSGIESIIDLSKLNIYPNPSSGIINVSMELKGMDNVTLTVFDVNGKRIMQKKYDNVPYYLETQVDLSGYGDGIYHVQLKTSNALLHRILIKE